MGSITYLLARDEDKRVLESIQATSDFFPFLTDLWKERGDKGVYADKCISNIATHLKRCYDTIENPPPIDAFYPMVLLNAAASHQEDMLTMGYDSWLAQAQWIADHAVPVSVDYSLDIEDEVERIGKEIEKDLGDLGDVHIEVRIGKNDDDDGWDDY